MTPNRKRLAAATGIAVAFWAVVIGAAASEFVRKLVLGSIFAVCFAGTVGFAYLAISAIVDPSDEDW